METNTIFKTTAYWENYIFFTRLLQIFNLLFRVGMCEALEYHNEL